MHRQSLGTPSSSKLHHTPNGSSSSGPPAAFNNKDDISHITVNSQVDVNNVDDAEETKKKCKTQSHKLNNTQIVHLIPLLILLCIVVLFLFSHASFEQGLGELNELEEMPAATMDLKSNNKDRIRYIGDGSDVLGIQSMRNLQQAAAYNKVNSSNKYRLLHRKFGDFKLAS